MKRPRVRIDFEIRAVVLMAVVDRLLMERIPLSIATLNSSHLHVLAKCADRQPRHWIGRAKYHASMIGKEQGICPEGGYWAKRGGVKPIVDRAHQVKTFHYLLNHRKEGAFVYVSSPRSGEHLLPPLQR